MDARLRFSVPAGRPVYGLGQEPPPGPDIAELDRQTIGVVLSEMRHALASRDFASVADTVNHLLTSHGLPEAVRAALSYGVLEAHVKLAEEMQRRALGLSPVVMFDEPPGIVSPSPAPAAAPAGPLFSELLPKYVDLAVTEKRWRRQSQAQNKDTFSMFKEVCGDLPVNTYTRAMLSDFYETLRAPSPCTIT